jgi:hypothetical protein
MASKSTPALTSSPVPTFSTPMAATSTQAKSASFSAPVMPAPTTFRATPTTSLAGLFGSPQFTTLQPLDQLVCGNTFRPVPATNAGELQMDQSARSNGGKDRVRTAVLFKRCDHITSDELFVPLEFFLLGLCVVDQQPFRHTKMSRKGRTPLGLRNGQANLAHDSPRKVLKCLRLRHHSAVSFGKWWSLLRAPSNFEATTTVVRRPLVVA